MASADNGSTEMMVLVGDEGQFEVTPPLQNPLVVRKILHHFNDKELVELSTVNKLWNYEARRILRDHRTCVAYIGGRRPCEDAKALNDQLEAMNVIPFYALSICINGDHECAEILQGSKVDQVYGSLLQLPLKQLSVYWYEGKRCPCGQLILRILWNSPTLERVELKNVNMALDEVELKEENRPTEAAVLELPQLRRLKFPNDSLTDHLSKQMIQELILSRAPNLEVLENCLEPADVGLLPHEKFGIIKSMNFHPEVDIEDEELLRDLEKFVESQPRLENGIVTKPIYFDEGSERHNRYWATLVASLVGSVRSGTLRGLTIDAFSMRLLGATKVAGVTPELTSVDELELALFQDGNPGILLPIPLGLIFPSVTSVTLSTGWYVLNEDALSWDTDDESIQRIPWMGVTAVELEMFMLTEPALRDLGDLFPNLKSMAAKVYSSPSPENRENIPFQLLWRTWPLLERLEITGRFQIKWDENFDAVFCGIYPEEAEILREMDDDFLKTVNIVSPFPAISHVRGLRELKMELETSSVDPPADLAVPKDALFLSKVTTLTAFNQLKDFKFELTVPAEASQYLGHLESPVKLKLLPPRPRRTIGFYDLHWTEDVAKLAKEVAELFRGQEPDPSDFADF